MGATGNAADIEVETVGRTYRLSQPVSCNYAANLRNLWDLPLQRLEIYCQPFQLPGGYFKVSPQASCNGSDWIGLERYFEVIEETIPFRLLRREEYLFLLKQHLQGPILALDQNACVLIDYLNRRPNYFHWFLDALPRLFAAEAFQRSTGNPIAIIVPEALLPWQWESLSYLGVATSQLIRVPEAKATRAWSFEHLITTFSHRHIRRSPTGHFDAFCPSAIQTLSSRLIKGAERHETGITSSQRLYISRGHAKLRRVRNEDDVMHVLSAYGFQQVCLDGLPLHEQIQLFRQATHVISAHGGALTNLLYVSPGCQILEVFQSGHGSRPDFFQLAAMRGATYSFSQAESLNAENDIEISTRELQTFLEASL